MSDSPQNQESSIITPLASLQRYNIVDLSLLENLKESRLDEKSLDRSISALIDQRIKEIKAIKTTRSSIPDLNKLHKRRDSDSLAFENNQTSVYLTLQLYNLSESSLRGILNGKLPSKILRYAKKSLRAEQTTIKIFNHFFLGEFKRKLLKALGMEKFIQFNLSMSSLEVDSFDIYQPSVYRDIQEALVKRDFAYDQIIISQMTSDETKDKKAYIIQSILRFVIFSCLFPRFSYCDTEILNSDCDLLLSGRIDSLGELPKENPDDQKEAPKKRRYTVCVKNRSKGSASDKSLNKKKAMKIIDGDCNEVNSDGNINELITLTTSNSMIGYDQARHLSKLALEKDRLKSYIVDFYVNTFRRLIHSYENLDYKCYFRRDSFYDDIVKYTFFIFGSEYLNTSYRSKIDNSKEVISLLSRLDDINNMEFQTKNKPFESYNSTENVNSKRIAKSNYSKYSSVSKSTATTRSSIQNELNEIPRMTQHPNNPFTQNTCYSYTPDQRTYRTEKIVKLFLDFFALFLEDLKKIPYMIKLVLNIMHRELLAGDVIKQKNFYPIFTCLFFNFLCSSKFLDCDHFSGPTKGMKILNKVLIHIAFKSKFSETNDLSIFNNILEFCNKKLVEFVEDFVLDTFDADLENDYDKVSSELRKSFLKESDQRVYDLIEIPESLFLLDSVNVIGLLKNLPGYDIIQIIKDQSESLG